MTKMNIFVVHICQAKGLEYFDLLIENKIYLSYLNMSYTFNFCKAKIVSHVCIFLNYNHPLHKDSLLTSIWWFINFNMTYRLVV